MPRKTSLPLASSLALGRALKGTYDYRDEIQSLWTSYHYPFLLRVNVRTSPLFFSLLVQEFLNSPPPSRKSFLTFERDHLHRSPPLTTRLRHKFHLAGVSGLLVLPGDSSQVSSDRQGSPYETFFNIHLKSQQDAQRIIDYLSQFHNKWHINDYKQKPYFFEYTTWTPGPNDLPPRPMDTIFMDDQEKHNLLSALDTFIESEDKYVSMGIPWHFGICLHGPPGTGKSSLISALSQLYQHRLCYADPSLIEKEGQLIDMTKELPSKSLFVIEDIDVHSVVKTRNNTQGPDSTHLLSTFLNVLDSPQSPHGMIFICTTNDIESIDPALLRPGRIDIQIELGYLTQQVFDQMIYSHLGIDNDIELTKEVTPSTISSICMQNLRDPHMAYEAIRQYMLG